MGGRNQERKGDYLREMNKHGKVGCDCVGDGGKHGTF